MTRWPIESRLVTSAIKVGRRTGDRKMNKVNAAISSVKNTFGWCVFFAQMLYELRRRG